MNPFPLIQRMLTHIHVLAEEIGPRGSTTEGERRGAEYCRAVFEQLGLSPRLETFRSAVSIFHPHLLGSGMMLAAFFLYPLGATVTAGLAALLSLLALVSELQELGFHDNLFRKLVPKGQSQNVFGVVPPAGEHLRDLVLIGHIDTQRTPLVFSTPTWVERYKAFTTAAFVLFALQVLLFSLGTVFQWPWIWPAAIPSAVCALLLAALCIEADRSPYTAGANDNASAVAMVLALAEEFVAQPLTHTRVWCVCTGCEEVQHYGAIDFFQRHRAEMKDPRGLVFELLGCAGPGWLTQEGIIVPFRSDPGLVRLAEELSAANPAWGAYPVQISGGNSELADCARFGVPAITFFGLTRSGEAPHWHQPGDTADKIQPQVLQRTYQMIRAMITRIDQG
jgi:hypothetical protein